MIGLELDDDAADAVDQERGANQIGRDLMHAAAKEGAFELMAKVLLIQWAILQCAILSHSSQYAKASGQGSARAVAIPGPAD